MVRSTLLFFFSSGGPSGLNFWNHEYSCMNIPSDQFYSKMALDMSSVKNYRVRASSVMSRNGIKCWSACQKVRARKENVEILGVPENWIFLISGRLRRSPDVFLAVFGPLRILLLLAAQKKGCALFCLLHCRICFLHEGLKLSFHPQTEILAKGNE